MSRLVFKLNLVALLGLVAFAACAPDGSPSARFAPRVVSIGGSVTETVYALRAGELLVGVDSSSLYPEEARRLPQVGYMRQLSAEGVLSLRPTMVLLTSDAGPPAAIEQIRSAGVPLVLIPSEHSVEGVKAKIRAVARALALEERGEETIRSFERDLAEAQRIVAEQRTRPRVLALIARGPNAMNVAGAGTAPDEMIRLAGGINAVSDFEGYKPLSPESAIAAAPEVILVPSRGLQSMGGVEALLRVPGLAMTPAGRAKRVVALDDLLLLGFGPRTGAAVRELCEKIHRANSDAAENR